MYGPEVGRALDLTWGLTHGERSAVLWVFEETPRSKGQEPEQVGRQRIQPLACTRGWETHGPWPHPSPSSGLWGEGGKGRWLHPEWMITPPLQAPRYQEVFPQTA